VFQSAFFQKIQELIYKPRTLLIVYIGAAIFAAVQLVSLGTHPYTIPTDPIPNDIMNKPEYMNQFVGRQLTEYNNYLIFKGSWFHLLEGKNLYGLFPAEHWDFFKYSPTFALFMGFIAYLPDMLGLSIWNILNAITVFLAIRMLPFKNKVQCLLLWFLAQELLTTLQNTQSNGLMCGLMIAAYASMQRGKSVWGTLWLVLATYIKVYGAVGFCLFLFYPGKPRFILYAAMWTIIFAALPLLVTPLQTLIWQYQNWVFLLKSDASAATGLSVAGWLKSWFGIMESKTFVSVAGLVLFFVPLVRFRMYKDEVFRLLFLAFMLLWVIIFNHKAESSTFVIAVAGVGIWYFAMPKTVWRKTVLWTVFIFTCLATTDIFPPYVKKHFIYPYTIKAVPCIIAWVAVLIDIMRLKPALPPNGDLAALQLENKIAG
jgi:hypothetical protein